MVARPRKSTPQTGTTSAGVIASEIAEKYGRTVSTVQRQWMTHAKWPDPTGKRGHWNEYDPAEVDSVVRRHFLRATATTGGPDDLLTVAQIAEYTGLAEATIRADISRKRIPREPDDHKGAKRWKRSTIDAAMASRRRYSRR
ncbi:helix-turn-helix transcriptional regulator [Nocardia gipuzkoensis]|uniref:helix-turn-helix transcriptional regulator n=1 Tax=Nocardia gipuzkoensis TaxID=2749991 RepID=UPI00237E57AB|nr:hypothetical protein [Nocardia gipuzkoensis]MDE1672688.1 hypothetical protein [Nocardia gipuzkoensis]